MRAYEPTDRLLTEHFQRPSTRLDGEGVVNLEPALKEGLAGGYYYEHDSQLRPDRLMSSWRSMLTVEGVRFLDECPLEAFEPASGSVRRARTPKGDFEADAFVVATGALTPRLEGLLGFKVPIQPGKGYSLTMPRPSVCPRIPLIFPETRVAVSPFQSGYRLGSTMEFAGYDDSLRPERLQLLKDGARPYLREPYGAVVEQEWFGWRPMTYDSLPIIDRSPKRENVWVAAGHNMLGMSMAPATGKLVAELLSGEKPHLEPSPYRASRFG
jgi:D-amino-acid dehydrogenase